MSGSDSLESGNPSTVNHKTLDDLHKYVGFPPDTPFDPLKKSNQSYKLNSSPYSRKDSKTPIDDQLSSDKRSSSQNSASPEHQSQPSSSKTENNTPSYSQASPLPEQQVWTIEEFEESRETELKLLRLFIAVCSTSTCVPLEKTGIFPIILELSFQLIGPIGLLGNLASIMSIADHWRGYHPHGAPSKASDFQATVPDVWWVYMLNSIALVFGCLANVVLLLHMELRIAHHLAVMLTSLMFAAAVVVYMIILGIAQHSYFDGTGLHRTIGYWQAPCASVLYAISATITIFYAIYFRNRKWDIVTSERQRFVTMLCYLYFFWIAGGAAIFHIRSMGVHFDYAQNVYFVIVSCLTLGYGDIVAKTTLGKMLVIPLIYGGIIIGGWVALAVFQGNLDKAHNEAVDYAVERRRLEALEHTADHPLSDRGGFNKMRKIVRDVLIRDQLLHTLVTTMWLLVFLLCGAMIFHFTESWEYYNAFYMCAISLVEVGYGDYVPQSPGGRAMFIHYALVALPTTAAAVSDISGLVILLVKHHITNPYMDRNRNKNAERSLPEEVRQQLQQLQRHSLEWVRVLQQYEPHFGPKLFVDVVADEISPNSLWQYMLTLKSWNKKHEVGYIMWSNLMCGLLHMQQLPENFWLSDHSPVRHATLNDQEFLMLVVLNILSANHYPLVVRSDMDSTNAESQLHAHNMLCGSTNRPSS